MCRFLENRPSLNSGVLTEELDWGDSLHIGLKDYNSCRRILNKTCIIFNLSKGL